MALYKMTSLSQHLTCHIIHSNIILSKTVSCNDVLLSQLSLDSEKGINLKVHVKMFMSNALFQPFNFCVTVKMIPISTISPTKKFSFVNKSLSTLSSN